MKQLTALLMGCFSFIVLTSFNTLPSRHLQSQSEGLTSQLNIEADITYCLSKAIGIDNVVKHDRKYTIQRKLNIPEDVTSNRFLTVIKRVATKTNQFRISRLPSNFKIKFEKQYFEDDDNDHLKNMNDVEWEITCLPNRKYTVKMHYFIYGSLDPNGQIETTFDLVNKTYNTTLSVGQVDSESDGYYETRIKINNDVVVSYSKKKTQ